jgi:hypothetical protein
MPFTRCHPARPALKGTADMGTHSRPDEPSEFVPLDIEILREEVRQFLYRCCCVRDEQESARHQPHFDDACNSLRRLRIRLRYGKTGHLDLKPENQTCVEYIAKWVEECWKSTFSDEAQDFQSQQLRSLSEVVTDNVLFVASCYAIETFVWPEPGEEIDGTDAELIRTILAKLREVEPNGQHTVRKVRDLIQRSRNRIEAMRESLYSVTYLAKGSGMNYRNAQIVLRCLADAGEWTPERS